MIGLDHRRFRALAQGRGAVRRARGAARHQPDLDRDAVRSRRAALSRHGDLGRRGRQDRARRRAQRAGAGRLGHRQRRQADQRPGQLRQGGALLPLGGPEGGYKGTGLAVMVEILCGLLTGLGFGVEPTGRHNDGCFMACFKVDAFRPLAEFKKEVGEFIRYLKETPPAEGSSGVLYPGEIEHMREQDRRRTASRSRTRPGTSCKLARRGLQLTEQLGMGDVE